MPRQKASSPRTERSAQRPEKVFRMGYISASIFGHEVDTENGKRMLRSVNLQRRYRDGDDWKYTTSFGLADLPLAIRLLELAQQYVESIEVEVPLDS